MIEEYIEILRPFVYKLFKDDSSGHDIGHLERTKNMALYLQKKEGGDEIIIGISAFLHDVHRIMQNEKGTFVSPKDSLDKVKEMLSYINISEDQIKKICYCIEYHEQYNWNENNVSDLNTLIVQDADNIDAIGAIGIGRTFSYGASNNIIMYDSTVPLNEKDDYSEYMDNNESTIHHFYHKLFKLGNNMNTKTAKEIANKRIDFMKNFVEEFLNEWEGNY